MLEAVVTCPTPTRDESLKRRSLPARWCRRLHLNMDCDRSSYLRGDARHADGWRWVKAPSVRRRCLFLRFVEVASAVETPAQKRSSRRERRRASAGAATIELETDGVTVRVGRDAATIAAVIRALSWSLQLYSKRRLLPQGRDQPQHRKDGPPPSDHGHNL